MRSAYSVIIREARDCSTSLLDPKGRIIVQAQFCPIHMNSFGMVFEAFACRYDLSHIRPQDGLITNDPYNGGQHLNDIVIFTPIFFRGEVAAYAAFLGHHSTSAGERPAPTRARPTSTRREFGFRRPASTRRRTSARGSWSSSCARTCALPTW